jgi:modulator of FtsH protease
LNVTVAWTNFLVAEASASAALAGLIFVAVSINIKKIIKYNGVAGRAAEALSLLIGVLLISTFGLAPNQSDKLLGAEILAIGVLLWLMTVILQAGHILVRRRVWWWLASRALLCQCATVPFCIAGILLIRSNPDGMYWLIPGCVFTFLASTISAWVLLIEILR